MPALGVVIGRTDDTLVRARGARGGIPGVTDAVTEEERR